MSELISGEFVAFGFEWVQSFDSLLSRSRLVRFPGSGEWLPTWITLRLVRCILLIHLEPRRIIHRSLSPSSPFFRLIEYSDAFPHWFFPNHIAVTFLLFYSATPRSSTYPSFNRLIGSAMRPLSLQSVLGSTTVPELLLIGDHNQCFRKLPGRFQRRLAKHVEIQTPRYCVSNRPS